MTSRRLTELAEFDRAADEIVKELEALQRAIPFLILVIRLGQIQAQRELREAEELALMGQRAGRPRARSPSSEASAPGGGG